MAVAHHAMRALIVDLLARQQPGWAVSAVDGPAEVGAVLAWNPDVTVVDAADFAGCCGDRLGSFPAKRVVVIGPEPDPAYRQATLDKGAGALGQPRRRERRAGLGHRRRARLFPPTLPAAGQPAPAPPPPRSKEDADDRDPYRPGRH